jgi:hypothetical protein
VQFGANPPNHTAPYRGSFNDKYISITNIKASLVIATLLTTAAVYLTFMSLNFLIYEYSVLRYIRVWLDY